MPICSSPGALDPSILALIPGGSWSSNINGANGNNSDLDLVFYFLFRIFDF